MKFYHENCEIRHGADTVGAEVDYQKTIVLGKFHDAERPTWEDRMTRRMRDQLGERFVPASRSGGGEEG